MVDLPKYAGAQSEDILYQSIGRYLSFWEKTETLLGLCYCCIVGGNPGVTISAYGSLTGFEVRRKMTAAASEMFFENAEENKNSFGRLLNNLSKQSSHRHKIAHGQVHFITKMKGRKGGYFLCAPFYNTRSRPYGDWSKYFYNGEAINEQKSICDDLSTQLRDQWLEGPLRPEMQRLKLQLPKKFQQK